MRDIHTGEINWSHLAREFKGQGASRVRLWDITTKTYRRQEEGHITEMTLPTWIGILAGKAELQLRAHSEPSSTIGFQVEDVVIKAHKKTGQLLGDLGLLTVRGGLKTAGIYVFNTDGSFHTYVNLEGSYPQVLQFDKTTQLDFPQTVNAIIDRIGGRPFGRVRSSQIVA